MEDMNDMIDAFKVSPMREVEEDIKNLGGSRYKFKRIYLQGV